MKPYEIAKGIYNVGVVDWNIRDFHGYSTDFGTTYNAFLIVDEKVVLVDTVKSDFSDQLLENISQVIDPTKIDMVISNHTEMDHSGSLPRVMQCIGEDKPLYCSKMGEKSLKRHFGAKFNYQAVKNGMDLNIGKRTLTFLETRMLHWPDSMFTYVKEDKILFSSDAFGQHYAGPQRFDDDFNGQIGDAIMPHAKKYFANILLLYTAKIQKLIEQVGELGLEFDMICPDHGIIWRKDPQKIIAAYAKWSKQQSENKAVVIYDTMWHSTEKMAERIARGISASGMEVRPMNIRKCHRSDIMTEVMDAKLVVVGSPTLNNGLFPTVSDILTYIKGLKPQNKLGAAFGSYGWSGESVKLIQKSFDEMKIETIDSLKIQYVPDTEGLVASYEFGRKIGQSAL